MKKLLESKNIKDYYLISIWNNSINLIITFEPFKYHQDDETEDNILINMII